MKNSHINLSDEDKVVLLWMQHQIGVSSKVFKRITLLLALDKGGTVLHQSISTKLPLLETVDHLANMFNNVK